MALEDQAEVVRLIDTNSEHIQRVWSEMPLAVVIDTPDEVYVFGLHREVFTEFERVPFQASDQAIVDNLLWCWRRHCELGEPGLAVFLVQFSGGRWRANVAHSLAMSPGGQA